MKSHTPFATHLLRIYFFEKPLIKFSCTSILATIIMQNFKTTPWSRSRVMMPCHFHDKMTHLPQMKTINISSVYLLAPFMVQNFKKKTLIDPEI